jgi:hypothetical protein
LSDMVFAPAMHAGLSMWAPPSGTMNVALVYNTFWRCCTRPLTHT